MLKDTFFRTGLASLFCVLGLLTLRAQEAEERQRLYISMGDNNPELKDFFASQQIESVPLFDARYFDPKENGKLDLELFKQTVEEKIPDPLFKGIAVLDWEGKPLQSLHNQPSSSPIFKKTLASYIQLIKFAKSLRPNVQWGYYAIPFTTYWKRDDQWRKTGSKIGALLKQCDMLFPTFYVYYKDGSVAKGDNAAYAADNINEMLVLAKKYDKQVLPFVWHRYHTSNSKIPLRLIPLPEFTSYIDTILGAEYMGKKASGIVWWGSDKYYYNIKSKALVDEYEKSGEKKFDTYSDSLISNYSSQILQNMKSRVSHSQ